MYSALVLGDPRLSVGFGGKRADLVRELLRDADLDGESTIVGGITRYVAPLWGWVCSIGSAFACAIV